MPVKPGPRREKLQTLPLSQRKISIRSPIFRNSKKRTEQSPADKLCEDARNQGSGGARRAGACRARGWHRAASTVDWRLHEGDHGEVLSGELGRGVEDSEDTRGTERAPDADSASSSTKGTFTQ